MNTQVYLMLIRDFNVSFFKKRSTGLKIAAALPALIKNAITGDSLDLPFVGMIRVDNVVNKIGFGEDATNLASYADIAQARMNRHSSGEGNTKERFDATGAVIAARNTPIWNPRGGQRMSAPAPAIPPSVTKKSKSLSQKNS